MLDDNYIVNRIIDILNSQNQNLLIGNITSPRPGSICQVSTPYGIKSAYNINCTYPGDACVVWDKDEEQYYVFTVNPSKVVSSRQLSFRKNRPQDKVKSIDNYIKILYKSTIGNTVKIYVGGCYEIPKLLYTYTNTTTYPYIEKLKIDSVGQKPDDWIVGAIERTGISPYVVQEINTSYTSNLNVGKCLVYTGSSTANYISPVIATDAIINTGRGLFISDSFQVLNGLGSQITFISSSILNAQSNGASGDNTILNVSYTLPNFYKGLITNQNYVGQFGQGGGTFGITGLLSGLPQGSGTAYLTDTVIKSIRSISPGQFGTINNLPNNVDAYATLFTGNNNQYIYRYTYFKAVQSGATNNKLYLVSSNYGEIDITDNTFSNTLFNDINYINWLNNKFIFVQNNLDIYLGTGVKENDIVTRELQANGTFISAIKKAKFYGIPKASNETVEMLSASYYLT